MIFKRSIPSRRYKAYERYTPLLRRDFQYRCAYCLTQEFFVGGEAGFEIDHHRPVHGPYGRVDLVAEYTNLYWVCAECNRRKGDKWPSREEEAVGLRFLDPCHDEDDHDLHWIFHADGTLQALTPVAEYTEDKLMLWREFLVQRRAQVLRDQADMAEIEARLQTKEIAPELRAELTSRLLDIRQRLEPPIINRPRRTMRHVKY